MPEGPEVKRFAEQLSSILVGREISRVSIVGGRYVEQELPGLSEFWNFLNFSPCEILEVGCKGKFLYWRLEGDWSLWCTLGMTGRWSRTKEKHSAVRIMHRSKIAMPDVSTSIFFEDQRRFGTLKFVQGRDKLEEKLASLGIDLLQEDISDEQMVEVVLRKPKRTIAETLMDQSLFAGVGNYVKAEALYQSKISPHRTCEKLTVPEMTKLRDDIADVLRRSYAVKGNTIRTYSDVEGEVGGFASMLKCYGKSKDPAGREIKREETLDGRTTWWCPELQT